MGDLYQPCIKCGVEWRFNGIAPHVCNAADIERKQEEDPNSTPCQGCGEPIILDCAGVPYLFRDSEGLGWHPDCAATVLTERREEMARTYACDSCDSVLPEGETEILGSSGIRRCVDRDACGRRKAGPVGLAPQAVMAARFVDGQAVVSLKMGESLSPHESIALLSAIGEQAMELVAAPEIARSREIWDSAVAKTLANIRAGKAGR